MLTNKAVAFASAIASAFAITLAGGNATAATITDGFTFSVADDFFGPSGQGTHFHSSTGGDFGNPAGKAEVGGFFGSEEVRGLSEYNLSGLTTAGPAFVTFNVFNNNGLFGQGGGPFEIQIYAYDGNNAENITDWEAPSLGLVGTFNTSTLSVGDVLSFDVNAIVDSLISSGGDSLGIRLQQATRDISGPAYTFDTFRLTTDDQNSNGGVSVPGPLPLLGVGAAFGYSRKLRKRIKTSKTPEVLSAIV